MNITRHTTRPGTYTLTDEIWLPREIHEVFEFFSDAFRLEDLTPPFLHFHVVTPKPIVMQRGLRIDYKLRLHGLPLRWQSEISEWDPPYRFVDRQIRGPYRLWHHLHTFEELDGGTLVRDIVDYSFIGGDFIHWLTVHPDLVKIFTYRHQKLREFFGSDTRNMTSAPQLPSALNS